VARKVVKVYLTPEQERMLERICHSLGMDESEVLHHAFMEYARRISLIIEKVHGKCGGSVQTCRVGFGYFDTVEGVHIYRKRK